MKKILSLLSLFFSVNVYAQCEHMYPAGKPTIVGNFVELCRKGYVVHYNNAQKIPFVTYEKLTPDTIGYGNVKRTSFRVDAEVAPQYRSKNKDFEKTGQIFDRGHLAAAQNAGDEEAMYDTMLLSNIVPQVNSFNRGSWKTLETRIAKIVRRGGTVFVITGVISDGSQTIGDGVAVPQYLFKVIKSDNTVLTYILPNETNNMSYRDFKVPYSELVKKININLLPELSNIEQGIK